VGVEGPCAVVPFLRGDGIMCEMGPNQNSAGWRTKKGPKDQQKKATMTCQLGEIRQKFWKMRRFLRASLPVKDSGKGVRISGDCL
jgi:hypothetical protein